MALEFNGGAGVMQAVKEGVVEVAGLRRMVEFLRASAWRLTKFLKLPTCRSLNKEWVLWHKSRCDPAAVISVRNSKKLAGDAMAHESCTRTSSSLRHCPCGREPALRSRPTWSIASVTNVKGSDPNSINGKRKKGENLIPELPVRRPYDLFFLRASRESRVLVT